MKALRLHAINDLRLDDVDIPKPGEGQILIKIGACGICGSDIPRAFELGTKVYPITLGHEFSGTVIEVGSENDKDILGKRAAVFNVVPCMQCSFCRRGEYAHCENISYLGTRIDGGFAEYCLVPSRFNILVCDDEKVPFEHLAMIEPISVALHALRRSHIVPGDKVLVYGAGPIGLLIGKWAKALGVNVIALADIDPEKVAFAKKLGFTVFNPKAEDFSQQVSQITDGKGFNVVIEGTGSSAALNSGIQAVATLGRLTFLGNPHTDTTIKLENHSLMLRKELNISTVWNSYYADIPLNEWKYAIEALKTGVMDPEDLISHRMKLEESAEMFRKIYNKEIMSCKVLYKS